MPFLRSVSLFFFLILYFLLSFSFFLSIFLSLSFLPSSLRYLKNVFNVASDLETFPNGVSIPLLPSLSSLFYLFPLSHPSSKSFSSLSTIYSFVPCTRYFNLRFGIKGKDRNSRVLRALLRRATASSIASRATFHHPGEVSFVEMIFHRVSIDFEEKKPWLVCPYSKVETVSENEFGF